jgi:hypothetical protein
VDVGQIFQPLLAGEQDHDILHYRNVVNQVYKSHRLEEVDHINNIEFLVLTHSNHVAVILEVQDVVLVQPLVLVEVHHLLFLFS